MPGVSAGADLGGTRGTTGSTLAVLTLYPARVMSCPREGEGLGECLPLLTQLQLSQSVCEHWAGSHAPLGRGQLWQLRSNREAYNAESLVTGQGGQEKETLQAEESA